MPPSSKQVLSVREVTSRVRSILEKQIGTVWVEGECSNVSTPTSGHIYFTLKDEHSQIQAAWFKGRRSGSDLIPKNGMKIRVKGRVTAYEKGSQFQILVEAAEDAGLGDLRKRFDELKAKLQAEGLFEADRKRALPLLPVRIGIVTSPTGAAVRDILNVLHRRYPDRHLLIAPVPVQGDAAAGSIARAISYFDQEQLVDVMIVGRGGGSLEDLWAFNEEVVARAVSECRTPVISAVGHETDFTISDFTADLRAPTPSAAAELVIGRKQDFELRVQRMRQRLSGSLEQLRLRYRERLSRLKAHRLFHEPAHLVKRSRFEVQRMEDRLQKSLLRRVSEPRQELFRAHASLQRSLENRLHETQRRLDEAGMRLQRVMDLRMQTHRQSLRESHKQLNALNPYAVLRRGFSITRNADGTVIESFEGLQPGDELETLTREGHLRSTLQKIDTSLPFDVPEP